MDVALRAAVDRLMYEQAVALHMLDLAGPGALERRLPGSGKGAAEIFGEAEEALRRIEALLAGGSPEGNASGPPPATPQDAAPGLRALLRRVFAAAASLGGRRPSDDVLREVWRTASIYTALRPELLAAFPEAADDAVVRRWQRAPEPPADPPGPAAVDGGEGPG
ncbi:hypothetical protein [Tepidiforma sp.]|uniref:hypothetical protein n=1 Tax=Tepidiforma sp. TaxID=2682230 RepID=UPI00261B7DC7|nr:hypothetical protein [Tepidiforma sp.]MCX7616822.1 hypothetical protein [Tepidiforma sp.]